LFSDAPTLKWSISAAAGARVRSERVEELQRRQTECFLERFRFLRLRMFSFGDNKEDTLPRLECPQVDDKMFSAGKDLPDTFDLLRKAGFFEDDFAEGHAHAHLRGFVVFVALLLELAVISR
jgi:hypothetical protein